MRKAKKKSFNWYGMKQHFSIRKYHFGAASVLLGMSLVMGAGAQTVKAEEAAASSDATTASSTSVTSTEASTSTEEAVASTSSLTIDAQTVTDQERIATINYIVTYVLEDGTVVNASIETATINTTEEVAKATIPVYVELPAGYELATGQSANVTQEVVENGQNVVTVKVVKKVETTSSTTVSVASAAVTPTSTADNISSSTPTPTTEEEAKTVLEQVSSEAELLANEANRLVAADSTNEALKTAAAATKLVVTEATVVLNDSTATFEAVNAQIDAVRSNVEALVLELRKYSENGDIVVMLATTSSTSNLTYGLLNQGPGSDFETLQTSGQGAIADGFTVSPDMDDPAGATITRPIFTETAELKNDPTAGRYTFLVSNLDPYALVNETASRQNLYMTVSRDMTDPTNTDVYVRIVNKDTQILLGETVVSLGDTTKVLNGQIANVTITVPNPATNSYVPHTLNFTVTYEKITLGGKETDRLEFYYGSAESPDLRTRAVWQSNGLVQKGDPVHKLWSYVPKIATQTTYYRVQGTDELIGTYVISGLEGDKFTSSTQRDVTNYEYVSGAQESGQISEGYAIGTTAITVAPSRAGFIERRVKTFVSEDGDIVITIQRKAADADDSTYETVYTTGVLDNLKYWTAETTLEGYDATRPYSFPGKTAFWTLYNEFAEANVDTTYYYVQKGSVEVFYVDEKGNILQDSKVAIAHGDTGSGYDTTTLRDATIVKDGVTYYYKNIDGVGNAGVFAATTHADDERTVEEITAETGTVASNTIKELTYVYVPAGHVNINYVNEAGDVIKAKVVDTVDGEPGTTYDATQDGEKPTTIVAEDGKTYTFKEVSATSAGTTGEIEAGVTKEVIYVYEEVKGNVVVNYVTTDGTVIQAPVNDTTNASTGTTYDTTDNKPTTITTADGKSYRLVPALTIGNEKGEVVVGTTEVTYVYEEIKGDVVVNYVNTDGEVIAAQVVDTKTTSTGTAYDTTDHKPNKITTETGDVYYYKEIKAEDAAKETGKVVEGTTEVTYVYEQAGNVVVNYTLADGTVIKDPVNDETNAKPGSPYDTKDNKPETITTTDGKVYKLVPAATIGNETGDVEAGKTTEVTYVYEEVKGNVVVEYYNTAGEKIATDVEDTPASSTGTAYTTLDNKPETITAADGTVYYYKEVKADSAAETGDVVEGTTTVKYVYEQAGNVVVNYITEDGTPIKKPVNDETNAKPGTEYNTTDNKPTTITTEDGKTYELIPTATIGNETGDVEAGKTTEVTYVYKEVKGSVVVNYVTTDGTVLQAPVTDTPETSTGTPYDTTDNKPETITTKDGKTYKLVPKLTQGSETGDVVPGVTQVTYVYEEVKGDVVVNYVNTAGEVIAPQVVDTKTTSTGTAYDTADNKPEKIIEDATGDVYYYKEVQTGSNETGKVVEGTTEVTYVYEKAGNVVVNYITEDGTVIKTPVNDETNAKPGSPYDTTDNKPKTITTEDGTTYELVRTDGNENGSVEGGKTTEVTYVYRKVEAPVAKTGNVVVEYYNTDGEKIAADVEDTPETAVGTVYETLDYKPTTITKDGVKYYYKEVKATSATEKGTVSEGTTTVQYVYEPGGSVTVNYVTTDGAVIKSPVKDEENAEPGKSYTTEDNKPTTITTEDGKTYKLVPNATTGDENGTITSGEDKQVTYVYEEVKGNVVVNYIDTEGNVIKTPVEDTKSVSTGTAYDTTDNKPTTITTEDGTEYKLVPVLTKGEETGKVVEGTTQVTYVYQKVTTPAPKPNGSVVVNYVNTNGETIATSVNDTTDAKLDTPYDTTDYKPAIIKHDGVTYYYKEVKSGDSETGNVVEGTTEVTYIYEPGGSVTVNYVTTDGAVIKSPVKDEENAEPGKSYTTEDNKPTTITTEDGKTYKLVPNATTGDENGTITSGEDKQVTYVYEEVKGNVVVNYIDTEGNVIKTPVEDTKSASTGAAYDTTDNKPTTITTEDGTVYEIVPVLTIGSESGSVVEGTTQVTYVYRKVSTPTPAVKNGTVVVNYVTEDGTVIKSPVTDTPTSPEGTSYDTTDNKPTEITTEDGSRYVLIPSKTIGSENGTVEGGKTTEITYVYKKVANWIPEIPGVPENERPVVPYPFDPNNPDVPVTPNPGTVIPNVPGYTPVDPKDNTPLKPVDPNDPGKGYVPPTPDETGKDTPIPYVQNGNVVVNYVTEDGTVIKSPVNDETDAPAGKSYDTTDNKPTTITTEDGTTYELVRVDGSENGTVVGGKTTEVTYVYRKVETPAKKVVTNHVDEEGNPIAPQEEGTTPDKSIPGYEFTGKTITDEDGNTTHIYKKTPTKKVVTNHVDEEGNPVAPQEDGTTPNKSIPGYEYVRTVVDVEGNTTHIYRKVSNKPTPPATETPVKPQPATPTPTADKAKQLPNTGEASSSAGVLGAAMLVAAIALAGKRRRNED
ncbi:TPA: MucBP domain-containing protein [Streptococcus suis]|uniref:MucBP domain-containing protein n=1 Tax=Streptococcus suis TaxID=1307 RepID=UPI00209AD2B4|nr:MucBP domain-containing protein [Streptococcus suis]MCO8206346.1 MucBP domain-containing protein [Streptococcus suis]MCO8210700.1 MucBP domain-containing protein [Streptococcus suis]HEM3490864.1 MucBP domain-containing protein [Streptococcus suis]HEM3493488.1 MucBP domain-containing protein [Streptococcus suis]